MKARSSGWAPADRPKPTKKYCHPIRPNNSDLDYDAHLTLIFTRQCDAFEQMVNLREECLPAALLFDAERGEYDDILKKKIAKKRREGNVFDPSVERVVQARIEEIVSLAVRHDTASNQQDGSTGGDSTGLSTRRVSIGETTRRTGSDTESISADYIPAQGMVTDRGEDSNSTSRQGTDSSVGEISSSERGNGLGSAKRQRTSGIQEAIV